MPRYGSYSRRRGALVGALRDAIYPQPCQWTPGCQNDAETVREGVPICDRCNCRAD